MIYDMSKVKNKKPIRKIEMIRDIIVEMLNPAKVALFGSVVKELKQTGFDIDIFIEVDNLIENRVIRKLKERIDKLAGIYTVDLVFSYNASKELLDVIEREGVILYEKG